MVAAQPARPCLKWTTLVLMLLQNASFVLVMRYSRKTEEGKAASTTYNVAFVVTLQELFKLLLCVAVIACQRGGSLRAGVAPLSRPRELARIAVPAVCFVLQNNILYVALSNLDPLLFQITYRARGSAEPIARQLLPQRCAPQ